MIELRPFQKAALQELSTHATQPRHLLCVAPTGSGKSLIYERAAADPTRRTLLFTPLIALARQQYHRLQTLGIPTSLGIGGESPLPPHPKTGAWIMSPETLLLKKRQSLIQQWKPNLLVVDECHCLWDWGENFRPSFQLIPELFKTPSITQSIWLTATLPFDARNQLRQLIPSPLIEIGGFELPSQLRLEIRRVEWSDRAQSLLNWIIPQKAAGIVFVPTREATSRLARLIEATGKKVICYHGGMSTEERRNAESLIHKKIPEIIIATSAFGMGMDYSHLEYVVLWQVPHSLLSLVQAIGRVGRNPHKIGKALVFWDKEDFRMLEWTLRHSKKRQQEILDLLTFLSTHECRRAGLKRYFDRIESHQNCLQCDFCLGSRQSSIDC